MCQGAGSRSHVWGWRLCVKGQVPLRQSRTTGGRLEALFIKISDCVRGALKPVLYFLTYEYSWGQLMGYGFLFCSLPDASSLLQLGPVQNLGWGRTD